MKKQRFTRRLAGVVLAPLLAVGCVTAAASPAMASGLEADDTTNTIQGLSASHMWSNDGGTSWRHAKPSDLFKGRQTVLVAVYDEVIAQSTPWDAAKAYDASSGPVSYEGNIFKARWWTQGEPPSGNSESGNPWEKIRSAETTVLAEFHFTPMSGADADQYQQQERERLENMRKVVGYFPEWGVYEAHDHFTPDKIAYDTVTHLNYAFGVLDKDANGVWNVKVNDPHAAFVVGGGALPGIISAAEGEGVDVLASFGGWNNSQDGQFEAATATPKKAEHLAQSMVDFMTEYGFDGVDVDWEYPTTEQSAKQFTTLIKSLREKLTALGKENDEYYQLSAAVSTNHKMMGYINPRETSKLLDTVNVMSYDFNGAFNPETGHNAPLYANKLDKDQKLNTAAAMDEYHRVYGVAKSKLLVGVPYYGRGWGGVKGNEIAAGLPGLFDAGTATVQGKWDDEGEFTGTNPYSLLAQIEQDPGFVKYRDGESRVPYLFNQSTGVFYTYDDPASVQQKVDFILDEGYGGAIVWDISGDTADHRLGKIVAQVKGSNVAPPAGSIVRLSLTPDAGAVGAVLELSSSDFKNSDRHIVRQNGDYMFEIYKGKAYYSTLEEHDGKARVSRMLVAQIGDEISLFEAPGRPGTSTQGETHLQTITVTAEMLTPGDAAAAAVKTVSTQGDRITIGLDEAQFTAPNRFVVTVNGKYEFESYAGKRLYSTGSSKAGVAEIIKSVPGLRSGDEIAVMLAPGKPGQSTDGAQTLKTHVIP